MIYPGSTWSCKGRKRYNKESYGLQAYGLEEMLSLNFHASKFLVNRYNWLKSKIVLKEFV